MALGTSQSAPSLLKTRSYGLGAPTRNGEALLRSARVQIDREKLLRVVDLPFFISMRFKELENGLITLEVTGDGRFAYCERGPNETTVYEGVLVRPTMSATRFTVDTAEEDEESVDKEATMRAQSDRDALRDASATEKTATKLPSASIEGKALVRYERAEADGQSQHLTSVERGDFRFAITVRPSFEDVNMEVWVISAGQRQQRKHLARVDAHGNFMGEAFRDKNVQEDKSASLNKTAAYRLLKIPQPERPNSLDALLNGGKKDSLMTGTIRPDKTNYLLHVGKGLAKTKTLVPLRASRSATGLKGLPAI